jgi:hypothetical protein
MSGLTSRVYTEDPSGTPTREMWDRTGPGNEPIDRPAVQPTRQAAGRLESGQDSVVPVWERVKYR